MEKSTLVCRKPDSVNDDDFESESAGVDVKRRKFLKNSLIAAGGFGAITSLTGEKAIAGEQQAAAVLKNPESFAEGSHLERMRVELIAALKKPVDQRKWVMVIDHQKCVGCNSCTVSCNSENNLPPGVVYRPVTKIEVGDYPDVAWVFTPRPCMQCDNPPCVPGCPVKATWKGEDGVVVIDYDICIGCRNCIAACPYNARTADFGDFFGAQTPEIMDYETRPNFEYSKEWIRKQGSHKSPIGNARKCSFCLHRVREGMLPACVTTCLGGATSFGDYNDKSSLVHELVGSGRAKRLKEDLGTAPSVYYLI
ncbi:4Fe-4S dicluster domain-containing protein [Desulfobacula sp.]